MIRSATLCKVALLGYFALAIGQAALTQGKPHAKKPGYATIRPIIEAKCVSCHNDSNHPASVNLSSYTKLIESGWHGPIVMVGHPEKSKLLLYVDGAKQPRMPFGKRPLSKKEIAAVRSWIAAGAHQ